MPKQLTDNQVIDLVYAAGWATGDWQPRKKCFKYRAGETKLDAEQVARLEAAGRLRPLKRWPGEGRGLEVVVDEVYATILLDREIEAIAAASPSGFLKAYKVHGIASAWMSFAYRTKHEYTRDDIQRDMQSSLPMEGFRPESVEAITTAIWTAFTKARKCN